MDARRRPSPATIIASIALFVALGNTAVGQLGDDDGGTTVRFSKSGSFADALRQQLSGGFITSNMLDKGAVTGPKIGKAAVTGPAIKPQAITESKVQLGGLSGAVLAQGSIGFGQIQPGSLSGSLFQQGGIPGFAIGQHAITAPHIAPDAVETEKIAPEAITGGKISPFGIPGSKFQDGTLTTEKIKAGAITSQLIGDNEIATSKIQPGAVTSPLLGPGAVTTPKLGPLSVTAPTLATGAVGTQQLSTGIPSVAVTSTAIQCRNNNTASGVQFASELFDTANMWPSAGPGSINRITVPVNGIYQVTAYLAWTGDSSAGRRSIELNGTQPDNVTPFGPLGTSNLDAVSGGASETFQTFTGIYKLTAGQSVSILAGATNLSSASTCFGNTGQRASTMAVTYLNPGP